MPPLIDYDRPVPRPPWPSPFEVVAGVLFASFAGGLVAVFGLLAIEIVNRPPRLGEAMCVLIGMAVIALLAWGSGHAAYRFLTDRRRRWRESGRVRRQLCVGCGYDLRGGVGRCPECGHWVPESYDAITARLEALVDTPRQSAPPPPPALVVAVPPVPPPNSGADADDAGALEAEILPDVDVGEVLEPEIMEVGAVNAGAGEVEPAVQAPPPPPPVMTRLEEAAPLRPPSPTAWDRVVTLGCGLGSLPFLWFPLRVIGDAIAGRGDVFGVLFQFVQALLCSGLPGAMLLGWAWHAHTRRRRAWRASFTVRRRLCVTCGYDLRGTTGACPECGAGVPEPIEWPASRLAEMVGDEAGVAAARSPLGRG